MIKIVNGKYRYYDMNGTEITDGCSVKYPDGKTEKVYLTTDGRLGTDATNPSWIASGRALPCEYGIYPFGHDETNSVVVLK